MYQTRKVDCTACEKQTPELSRKLFKRVKAEDEITFSRVKIAHHRYCGARLPFFVRMPAEIRNFSADSGELVTRFAVSTSLFFLSASLILVRSATKVLIIFDSGA